MFEVVNKKAFEFATTGIEEAPKAIPFAILPLSLVDVLEGFRLSFVFIPIIFAIAIKKVLFPVAHVLLRGAGPAHGAEAMPFVIEPVALILIFGGVKHFAPPILLVARELPFIGRIISVLDFAFALLDSMAPLSIVGVALGAAGEEPETMLLAVRDLAFVEVAIRPFQGPETLNLGIGKLAMVLKSVGPVEGTFSVEKSVLHLPLVKGSICQLHLCIALQALVVNIIVLGEGRLATPTLQRAKARLQRQNCRLVIVYLKFCHFHSMFLC